MVTTYSDGRPENDGDNETGEQIRISLTLASECRDRSLEVPDEAIAVPATLGRKGLSAVLNHLLDRQTADDEDSEEENDERLPAISFDFILGKTNKLLRTGLEREARRSGLSLEEAIPVTYFPAQRAPELSGEGEALPDWISTLSFVSSPMGNLLFSGNYDGSMHVFGVANKADGLGELRKVAAKVDASSSPIKSMDTAIVGSEALVATGCMDHTLALHKLDLKTHKMSLYANCTEGHVSAIGSVDLFVGSSQLLVSGDWDGGISIWDCASPQEDESEDAQPAKKTKRATSTKSANSEASYKTIVPKVSIQAHSSQISGVAWGNSEKKLETPPARLISGSWDHSLKVWDVERQDCLLTLNGSRVVSCLDTSYSSHGIVATGHPDCVIRLWDVRTAEAKESSLSVSDTTFRPSHKGWISAVKWAPTNPYHLASTSHDGTVKLWDIRSTLPLHTVRAFPKNEKALSLTYGDAASGLVFAGGTDRVVKQLRSPPVGEEVDQ